eukprot:1146187-Pelagomonas_calceolata.AAC.1
MDFRRGLRQGSQYQPYKYWLGLPGRSLECAVVLLRDLSSLGTSGRRLACRDLLSLNFVVGSHLVLKRKVYAGHGPRASRKGPLTSKLARASPEVPQIHTSYS